MTHSGATEKLEGLKDGRVVLLREPTLDDVDRSLRFFHALSPEDRRYLRVDVTRREVVERRIHEGEVGQAHRIVAVIGEDIVADGALEFSGELWRRHLGEIRVIVSSSHRGLGVGAMLITELFRIAQEQRVDRVVVNLAAAQSGARTICERLGFSLDAVLPGHFKDSEGKLHDLVVMSCSLDEMWRELRDMYRSDDWPDG